MAETIRVAGSVPMFVVPAHHTGRQRKSGVLHDACARRCVGLQLLEFLRREIAGFRQDGLRYSHFADIVQDGGDLHRLHTCLVQTQPASQLSRVQSGAHQVIRPMAALGLDRQGQRLEAGKKACSTGHIYRIGQGGQKP